ncbi:hypothetical protein [Pseudomonas sp. Irchel 3A18]|uniref:hypothetical protein n=1 Tax=Pseudomonas sp. Irchel 3A18 TaxID=2008905 RepID=UPI000BA2CDF1|nr:hypothetical protein [Pseudomonas sp. Irchel 3A18]
MSSGQILRGWESVVVQCGMIAWGCGGGFGFSWVVSFQIGLSDFLGPGKAVALIGVAGKNIYAYQISENQLYRMGRFNESGVMARALYRREHQVLIKLLRTHGHDLKSN